MKIGTSLKVCYFTFLLFTIPLFGRQATHTNVIIPENKIIITGESNIQHFIISYYFRKLLKPANSINENLCPPKPEVLQIPVHKLLFSNRHIKTGFLRLVHAHEYPYIKLFYAPEIFNVQLNKQQQKIISITVQITDVQKTYQVPVLFISNNGPYTELKGHIRIKLSDFNLKPKRYLLGLISIKDALKINFNLYF